MINKNFYNNMTTRDEMNVSREELQAAQQQQQVNGRGVVRDLVNIYQNPGMQQKQQLNAAQHQKLGTQLSERYVQNNHLRTRSDNPLNFVQVQDIHNS